MMKNSTIQVICGPGKGKTASALGRGISALIGQARQSEAELIMTGTVYPAALDEWVDEVTKLQTRFE